MIFCIFGFIRYLCDRDKLTTLKIKFYAIRYVIVKQFINKILTLGLLANEWRWEILHKISIKVRKVTGTNKESSAVYYYITYSVAPGTDGLNAYSNVWCKSRHLFFMIYKNGIGYDMNAEGTKRQFEYEQEDTSTGSKTLIAYFRNTCRYVYLCLFSKKTR